MKNMFGKHNNLVFISDIISKDFCLFVPTCGLCFLVSHKRNQAKENGVAPVIQSNYDYLIEFIVCLVSGTTIRINIKALNCAPLLENKPISIDI